MIDTHAHLNFKDFDKDREEVISRAFQSGVKKIINIGTDLKESEKSIKLAEEYKNIYASVGIHPNSLVTRNSPKDKPTGQAKLKTQIEELRKLAGDKKVVAIGEIGLDYYRVSHSVERGAKDLEDLKKIQREGFAGQLELARELNLPVIIHCRASEQNPDDAYEDAYDIIKSQIQNLKCVFHCYGGNTEFTKKLLKHEAPRAHARGISYFFSGAKSAEAEKNLSHLSMGSHPRSSAKADKNIYFSFTGNITYKTKKEIQGTKNDIAESIKIIPLERIMLETDCPFLAPQKFRGKRNEPAYVKYTAEKLAKIKGINFEKVAKITTQNAEEFFGI